MTPRPLKLHTFLHIEKSVKMIHNRRKLRSTAKNWSVHVFCSVLNDFAEKIVFCFFSKNIGPKIEILTKNCQNFDIFTKIFWKNRKNCFVSIIVYNTEKHIH